MLALRPMRIGVISDTHDNTRNVARIVEVLREARVERVIHTGDITRADTLRVLAAVEVPLFGVYGNNDVEREPLAARGRGASACSSGRAAARARLGGAAHHGGARPPRASRSSRYAAATCCCTATTTATRSSA